MSMNMRIIITKMIDKGQSIMDNDNRYQSEYIKHVHSLFINRKEIHGGN